MHFGALRDRRFAKMFAGQTISELGSAVTQIALPTIAVLVLHAGSLQLGILIALQRVPFPILALLVGVSYVFALLASGKIRCRSFVTMLRPIFFLSCGCRLGEENVVLTWASRRGGVKTWGR